MKNTPKHISALLILVWLFSLTAYAQDRLREYEVTRIRFEGNETLSTDRLLAILQSRESPLWVWKFLYKISEKLGERPEYFDPLIFETDYQRVRNYFVDNGFFKSTVDTLIRENVERKTVNLTFRIQEGPRSMIDTVQYIGFDQLPDPLKEEIRNGALIRVGDPFVMERVVAERARIVNVFFDHGYIAVRIDSVKGLRFASTNNVKLVFAYSPGDRYRFGPINVVEDTAVTERVDANVVLRQLDFRQGDYYSERIRGDSERYLTRLGVFEYAKIEAIGNGRSDSTLDIPMRVSLRVRPFHELSPEIGVTDENNAFNIQLGVGYSNRNFFGGARNFSTRFRTRIQSIQDVNFGRVFGENGLRDSSVILSSDISMQLVQPYFINNKTNLIGTVSLIFDKQNYYFRPIWSNRIGITTQLARYTTGSIEWNLERIGFTSIDPKLASADSLPIDRRPVFNSIVTFTMQRDKRNDLFNPSEGFLHSGSIEEAGLLPQALGGLFGSELPYSKYYKFSLLGQWYWDPSGQRNLIWAARLRAGFAQLYGNSPAPVPITRRFFGGGSGSVRGWKARELGAVPLPTEGGTALLEGNLEARWNLLKNAGRFSFIELNRISVVLFLDAGNVWTEGKRIRANEIAIAGGFGFRWDTVAGPIRIDFGFKVYDPSALPGRQWITQRRFFAETFSQFVPHFGIGHAF